MTSDFEVSLEDMCVFFSSDCLMYLKAVCVLGIRARRLTCVVAQLASSSRLANDFDAQFMIHKKILCDHCRGSGAASDSDIETCPTCDGSGIQITRQQMFPGMVVQGQTTYTTFSSWCPAMRAN
jgi:hypothetical protein